MFDSKVHDGAPAVVTRDLLRLSGSVANLVCVCDDVFRDAGRYDPVTEQYRRGLAQICRALAAEFDVTCEVMLGMPKAYRGENWLRKAGLL